MCVFMDTQSPSNSRVSVIISTNNPKPTLFKEIVESIYDQLGMDDEIIIVIGGKKGNNKVVKDKKKIPQIYQPVLFDPKIKIVFPRKNGVCYKRNIGAKIANNNILAFTDQDAVPQKGWINTIKNNINYDIKLCFGADSELEKFTTIFEAYRAILQKTHSSRFNQDTDKIMDKKDYFGFANRNMAIERKKFLEIGGYDESFNHLTGEDLDLELRVLEDGTKIKFCKKMVTKHIHPMNLLDFEIKAWKEGISNYKLYKKYKNSRTISFGSNVNLFPKIELFSIISGILFAFFGINPLTAIFVYLIILYIKLITTLKRVPKIEELVILLLLHPIKEITTSIANTYYSLRVIAIAYYSKFNILYAKIKSRLEISHKN